MRGFKRRAKLITAAALAFGMLFMNTGSYAAGIGMNGEEISIDGYYDDWKDFPVTEITYQSNNTTCVHTGNIYSDGEYIYAHIKMNDLYTSQMMIHTFSLKVNNQEVALPIYGKNKDGSIDYSKNIYGGLKKGTHTDLGIFLGYYKPCDSSIAFTVHDDKRTDTSEGDEIEFRISIKDIAEFINMDPDKIDTFALRNPNIGGESLVCAGSSTAPMVGAAVGFSVAIGSWFIVKRKKRKMA